MLLLINEEEILRIKVKKEERIVVVICLMFQMNGGEMDTPCKLR